MDKLRHAVGAILAVLGTVGLVQIERNRERRLRSPFERHGPRPPVLTEDERSFRQALQHFSLSYPKQLSSLAGHVRAEVIAKIKEAGEQEYSYALFHALQFSVTSASRANEIYDAANVGMYRLNADLLAVLLKNFFDEYAWDQRGIANLNTLAQLDIRALPETQRWLDVDRACAAELRRLKNWPGAQELAEMEEIHKIKDAHMAAPGVNWTTPVAVNWQPFG